MEKQQTKNLVITGANEGIGFQTMRALFLTRNFNIIIASRNIQRNQQARQKVLKEFQSKYPQQKPPLLESLKLDLASKSSIEKFIKEVKNIFSKIDILINNAGALFNEKEIVKELTFQVEKTLLVDYFSIFYMTFLAFKQKIIDLNSIHDTKIIFVSSSAHQYCPNGMFQDLTCTQKYYSTYRQYMIAKFFLTAFTKQLGRRLQKYFGGEDKLKIKAVSLHPGVIATNIGSDVLLAKIIKFVGKLWMKSNAEGAKSTIALSLLEFKRLKNGGYYNEVGNEIKADKRTQDPAIGQRLWKLSEQAFQIKFTI